LEATVGDQTRSQNEVGYATVADCNELLWEAEAEELRTEASVPASLDGNTKCLEQHRFDDNALE
jgi:hypothetical protein